MKALKSLDDTKVVEKGMQALHKALGPAATRRFIFLARIKREDSVARHRAWQEKLDKDVFFDKVFDTGSK